MRVRHQHRPRRPPPLPLPPLQLRLNRLHLPHPARHPLPATPHHLYLAPRPKVLRERVVVRPRDEDAFSGVAEGGGEAVEEAGQAGGGEQVRGVDRGGEGELGGVEGGEGGAEAEGAGEGVALLMVERRILAGAGVCG